ncbi:MAG: hypothetical protein JWM31_1710 [Solirubrobacterales bacterium]|nr:hypothetical protein [Solirubrobacterales bacterium]
MLATVVDGKALWQTVWTGALAGVGVCVVFALTILGAARSSDSRRAERSYASAAYAALAVLGAIGSLAIVAFGVTVITTK